MTVRRPGAAGLLAAACASALVAAGCGGGSRAPTSAEVGPIGRGTLAGNAVAAPVRVGEPFFFGQVALQNAGPGPAVLRGVELVGATPGLRVVGARVAGPGRAVGTISGGTSQFLRRQTRIVPLAGYRLAPGVVQQSRGGAELILDLQVPRAGRYAFRYLRIAYDAGGRRWSDPIASSFAACAARDLATARRVDCAAPPIPKPPLP